MSENVKRDIITLEQWDKQSPHIKKEFIDYLNKRYDIKLKEDCHGCWHEFTETELRKYIMEKSNASFVLILPTVHGYQIGVCGENGKLLSAGWETTQKDLLLAFWDVACMVADGKMVN